MYGYCYDATGSRCSGKAQPGTLALRAAIRKLFPGIGDLGIYNCRPTRGGGSLSTHGEGRGWDAACNAHNNLPLGDKLAATLVINAPELGIQRVIWNHRQWDSRAKAWRTYGGVNPHTDHLHIELCWSSARDKPLTEKYINEVLGSEDDLTPEQSKKLDEIWNALYEKKGGKFLEATDQIRDLVLDAIEKTKNEILAAIKDT